MGTSGFNLVVDPIFLPFWRNFSLFSPNVIIRSDFQYFPHLRQPSEARDPHWTPEQPQKSNSRRVSWTPIGILCHTCHNLPNIKAFEAVLYTSTQIFFCWFRLCTSCSFRICFFSRKNCVLKGLIFSFKKQSNFFETSIFFKLKQLNVQETKTKAEADASGGWQVKLTSCFLPQRTCPFIVRQLKTETIFGSGSSSFTHMKSYAWFVGFTMEKYLQKESNLWYLLW